MVCVCCKWSEWLNWVPLWRHWFLTNQILNHRRTTDGLLRFYFCLFFFKSNIDNIYSQHSPVKNILYILRVLCCWLVPALSDPPTDWRIDVWAKINMFALNCNQIKDKKFCRNKSFISHIRSLMFSFYFFLFFLDRHKKDIMFPNFLYKR